VFLRICSSILDLCLNIYVKAAFFRYDSLPLNDKLQGFPKKFDEYLKIVAICLHGILRKSTEIIRSISTNGSLRVSV